MLNQRAQKIRDPMQGGTMGIPRLEIRAEGSGRDVIREKREQGGRDGIETGKLD